MPVHVHAVNGIALNVERAGSDTGSPLVLLHGFTGSARSWDAQRAAFARHCALFAVDLIGHGESASPPDPARYRMERCVADLLALFDQLGIERATVLGYSLGGRVALHLALAAPERVERLILESASPGIPDPAERAHRIRADEALADAIERDGLEAFVDRWERLPLFASQASLPEAVRQRHREQRLRNNPLGLANSLRGMGAGAMEPVVDRLDQIAAPTLLIAGEQDAKYGELARMMAARMPNARAVIVPGAGHTVHLEQPERFNALVLASLPGGVGVR